MLCFLTIICIQETNGHIDNNLLCQTTDFLIMRSGGEIITFFFLIIGIVITVKVKRISKQKSKILDKMLLQNFNESLKKLWIVIIDFSLVCIFLLAFDIVGFYSKVKSCDALTDSIIANDALWFLSRSVSDYLWIIPLIVIFSPSLNKKDDFLKKKKQMYQKLSLKSDFGQSVISDINQEEEGDYSYFQDQARNFIDKQNNKSVVTNTAGTLKATTTTNHTMNFVIRNPRVTQSSNTSGLQRHQSDLSINSDSSF